jgi:hypothetical protein
MIKVPPPFKQRIDLPQRGRHQLAFHWGSHVDRYTLTVEPEWFDFSLVGKSTFTQAGETGRFLRAGADWLWVTVGFLGPTAGQRLGAKRDALLRELESLGARSFEPPSGRYLLGGGATYVPRSTGPAPEEQPRTEEPRFLRWTGDWNQVEALVDRYSKYDPPARVGGNTMTIWMNQRSRHASTYGRR